MLIMGDEMTSNITNIAYCPHCGNQAPQRLIHKQRYFEKMWDGKTGEPWEDAPWSSFVVACTTCENVLIYDNPGDQTEENRFSKCELVYPKPPFLSPVVPPKITTSYAEAFRVRHVSPNAFAVLIRRTLEILCDERGTSKGTLSNRLKFLSDKGELPPILSQTTDLLRLIGNIGAHSSERSVHPLHVRAIDDFFLAIIEYLYVAPQKIADFQQRLQALKGIENNSDEPAN
jgi:hypothetical protein